LEKTTSNTNLKNEKILKNYEFMINKGDLVTGFTPLHWAIFTENIQMMSLLIRYGADVEKKDNYTGDPFDYARMLGFIPTRYNCSIPPHCINLSTDPPKKIEFINVWNPETSQVVHCPISKFEEFFKVEFCPFTTCTNDYIEELLFSGLSIQPDLQFREEYVPQIYNSSGDENLIVSKINDNVGYGVFAAKNFKEGEFVVRYGGRITKSEKIKDKSYNMASGVEGVGLNAKYFRNLGGMINHSSSPNCESQCIFDRGAEQAVIIANTIIHKGDQILIDYSKNYWTKGALKSHNLEDITNIMTLPI